MVFSKKLKEMGLEEKTKTLGESLLERLGRLHPEIRMVGRFSISHIQAAPYPGGIEYYECSYNIKKGGRFNPFGKRLVKLRDTLSSRKIIVYDEFLKGDVEKIAREFYEEVGEYWEVE